MPSGNKNKTTLALLEQALNDMSPQAKARKEAQSHLFSCSIRDCRVCFAVRLVYKF